MNHPNTTNLERLIQESPYQSYTYAYPHKTAYRPLEEPLSLAKVWEKENWDALFLYLHIPFCSMRCGFCNLFTLSRPQAALQTAYVAQMLNYIKVYADVFQGKAHFASVAFGGGTPSYLETKQLAQLLEACTTRLGVNFQEIPSGVEVSPETVQHDKMQLFSDAGFKRVSMGVQSFFHHETDALVRKQALEDIQSAIATIRHFNFPTLNLDLIYGIAGQTTQRFLQSLQAAVAFSPEELYLYPLYVRPLTGLGRISPSKARIPIIQQQSHDLRLEMYQQACAYLLSEGYEQHSMRMFKKKEAPQFFSDYSCQSDGMVGIGCGARSYTQSLHYSEEYGVSRASVFDIIQSYTQRTPESLAQVAYGFSLSTEEQKRRFLLQSLLNTTGLDFQAYHSRFGSHVLSDFIELPELFALDLATQNEQGIFLTAKGLGVSDAIGPWLYSANVQALSAAYELQ